jgi:hypothetical protein
MARADRHATLQLKLALLCFCVGRVQPASVHHARDAFTPDECSRIVALFASAEADHDDRTVPLLPNMNGSFTVSRINRFASPDSEAFDWVYDRLLAVLRLGEPHMPSFRKRVAFLLLHEFEQGGANNFDWHADTKPGDGKTRRLNINVMLSSPGVHFGGGTLQVGAEEVRSSQGDVVTYAAALPHRVLPLDWGKRHTLVVALTDEGDTSHAATTAHSTSASGESLPVRPVETYWERVERAFEELSHGALADEPKLHILHGEFLEGLAGRAEDAKRAFCRAYQVTSHCSHRVPSRCIPWPVP